MLEEGDFLLQFLRVVSEGVLGHDILLLAIAHCLPFIVVESMTVRVYNNFSGVVEEHTSRSIGKEISQPILGGIVYPLFNPAPWCRKSLIFHLSFWRILLGGGESSGGNFVSVIRNEILVTRCCRLLISRTSSV